VLNRPSILLILDRCGPGEALRVAPLARAVAAAHPDRRVSLVVGEAAHPVFAGDTVFDRIVVSRLYGRRLEWFGGPLLGGVIELLRLLLTLRRRHDVAVTLLWGSPLLHVLGRLAGRVHVGYSSGSPGVLFTASVSQPLAGDDAALGRAELAAAGIALPVDVTSSPSAAVLASVARLLSGEGLSPSDRLLVVHTGSDWACQQWPPDRWAAVADEVASKHGAVVVFTGVAGDVGHVAAIRRLMRCESRSLAGRTDLAQLAALTRMAILTLTVDSAAHDAAQSVGARVIALAAPTTPQGPPERLHVVNRTPEKLRSAIVSCQDQFPAGSCRNHACPMAGMRPTQAHHVVAAAEELLGSHDSSRTRPCGGSLAGV
jgi:heptosyltransferase-2